MNYDDIKEKIGKTIYDIKETVKKEYNNIKKAVNEEKIICEYCNKLNVVKRGTTNNKCTGCGATLNSK